MNAQSNRWIAVALVVAILVAFFTESAVDDRAKIVATTLVAKHLNINTQPYPESISSIRIMKKPYDAVKMAVTLATTYKMGQTVANNAGTIGSVF